MESKNTPTMQVIYGDVVLGLKGKKFHYIFSYQTGGMESMEIDGKQWLYRTPKPTFWRATTDNDRGNGFSLASGQWYGADIFQKCKEIHVFVDGKEVKEFKAPDNNCFSEHETAKNVRILYVYETITIPSTIVQISYDVDKNGHIRIDTEYFGQIGLPELPVFGMRFVMPTCATKFVYQGLSGETYPDRKCGGEKGTYEVKGLPVTPYLVPQECGMHVDTDWVKIYRKDVLDNRQREKKETGIRFTSINKPFGFSCLPYTCHELENATHIEELPPKRRTVLCICGAVRGVGGIDSWGSDVEQSYHIPSDKNIAFSFLIDF